MKLGLSRERSLHIEDCGSLKMFRTPEKSASLCGSESRIESCRRFSPIRDSQLVGSIPPYTSLAISFFYYFVRKSYENTVGVHPAL